MPVEATDLPQSPIQASEGILICLLGTFSLLKDGAPILLRCAGKAEALLSNLAIYWNQRLPRETLLNMLWPSIDRLRAGQSLNTLVYSVNKQLAKMRADAPVVLYLNGYYRLNTELGIELDTVLFDREVDAGDAFVRAGAWQAGLHAYNRALALYRDDLYMGLDIVGAIERERLRIRYLSLLGRLADHYFYEADYVNSCEMALKVLRRDPCREDAHRLLMRCFVHMGQRSQALRQYRLCESMLRAEFEATPEPETTALFDQIRRDPTSL